MFWLGCVLEEFWHKVAQITSWAAGKKYKKVGSIPIFSSNGRMSSGGCRRWMTMNDFCLTTRMVGTKTHAGIEWLALHIDLGHAMVSASAQGLWAPQIHQHTRSSCCMGTLISKPRHGTAHLQCIPIVKREGCFTVTFSQVIFWILLWQATNAHTKAHALSWTCWSYFHLEVVQKTRLEGGPYGCRVLLWPVR